MKAKLEKCPIHLGLGATASIEPPFSGMGWYKDYEKRNADDGAEGRLVSMHTFEESWDSWEMHPQGSEVVLCTQGEMTVIQKLDDEVKHILLQEGEYMINPPGVWHTADVENNATAIFITAGKGTEHKPR